MLINPLGNIKAENDHEMLDHAFYDTQEYNSLIEDSCHRIVVGRRGTGKSALCYMLEKHWNHEKKSRIIVLTPEESSIIGVHFFIDSFGDKASHLRAACRILWEYALLNEIILHLADDYKVKSKNITNLDKYRYRWINHGNTITSRLYRSFSQLPKEDIPPEIKIANLPSILEINELNNLVYACFNATKLSFRLIADRLDEGYEPDTGGVAIITGLISALDKLTASFEGISSIVFFTR